MARSKKTAKNMTSEQALSSPETRKELFMAKAAGLIASAPSTPYTREERYWLAIIDAIAQAGFSPTEAQTAAMDSGITATILANILNGLDSRPIPTEAQLAAMDSGITATILANILSNLADKAPLASPTFTGTPVAPTATTGTNTTQIATTAFVKTAIDNAITNAIGGSY